MSLKACPVCWEYPCQCKKSPIPSENNFDDRPLGGFHDDDYEYERNKQSKIDSWDDRPIGGFHDD